MRVRLPAAYRPSDGKSSRPRLAVARQGEAMIDARARSAKSTTAFRSVSACIGTRVRGPIECGYRVALVCYASRQPGAMIAIGGPTHACYLGSLYGRAGDRVL